MSKQRFTLNQHIVCGEHLKDCIESIEHTITNITNSFPVSSPHVRESLSALQVAKRKLILASSEMEEVMFDDFRDAPINAYFGQRLSGES